MNKNINFSFDENKEDLFKLLSSGSLTIDYNILEKRGDSQIHIVKISQGEKTITVEMPNKNVLKSFDIYGYIKYLQEHNNIYFISNDIKGGLFFDENTQPQTNHFRYSLLSKKDFSLVKNIQRVSDIRNLDLNFREIRSISNTLIKVDFNGHEVDGSYVHDYEVAPNYIKQLELFLNCKVEWKGRNQHGSTGGFGFDVYHFYVYPKKVIDKDKYEPKGKQFTFNSVCAFEYEGGHEWMLMYIMSRYLKFNTKKLPDSVLKTIGIELFEDEVYFDGVKIFKIVSLEREIDKSKPNSGATLFNASFDLFQYEKNSDSPTLNTLFMAKYTSIVNETFKNLGYDIICKNTYYEMTDCCGPRIHSVMEDGSKYTIGSHLYIFSESDVYSYLRSNQNYINPNRVQTSCSSEAICNFKKVNLSEKDIRVLSKIYIYNNTECIEDDYYRSKYGKLIRKTNKPKRKPYEKQVPLALIKNDFLFFYFTFNISTEFEYEIIKYMVENNKTEWISVLVNSDYTTPKNYENRKKLNSGFSRVDFYEFANTPEMIELVSDWIIKEFKDDFIVLINQPQALTDTCIDLRDKINLYNASVQKKFGNRGYFDSFEEPSLFDDDELIEINSIEEKEKILKKIEKSKKLLEAEEENNYKLNLSIKQRFYKLLMKHNIDFPNKDVQKFIEEKFCIRSSLFREILEMGDGEILSYYFEKMKSVDKNTYEFIEYLVLDFDRIKYSQPLIDLISKKLELNQTQSGLLMYLSLKNVISPENIRAEILKIYPNCDFEKAPFPRSKDSSSYEKISINKMIIVDFLEKTCKDKADITRELNKIFFYCNFEYHSGHNSLFVNRNLWGRENRSNSSSIVDFKKGGVSIGLNYFSTLIDMEKISTEKVLIQLFKLDEYSLKEKAYNETYR